MSKLKNQMVAENRQKFYLELCYQEWLEEHRGKVREVKLNQMAKEFLEPYVLENYMLYVGSVNNIEYEGG
ncbi:hypothetical protein N9A28_03485 [Sulfurimonas sp.]|nr:hypothetical protein [Sulfurimonas sp.]